MPKLVKKEVPDKIKGYIFHGVDLQYRPADKEAIADCPFCDKQGKFSVTVESGVSRCLSCNVGVDKGKVIKGHNLRTFLRELLQVSLDNTSTSDYEELANERSYYSYETLIKWKLAKSIITGEWIMPGYGVDGATNTLYKYVDNGKRHLWMPTPTLGHQILAVDIDYPDKDIIYIVEGLHDCIPLYECLANAKINPEGKLAPTAHPKLSLLSRSSILGIAGCLTFHESWATLLSGKRVILMGQNDHPRKVEKTGAIVPSASYSGMERVANLLSSCSKPPADIQILRWGEEGYDKELPSGYDLRDHICKGSSNTSLKERIEAYSELTDRVGPIPESWLTENDHNEEKHLTCIPCNNYAELTQSWKKALRWMDGLDCALSVMLGVIASTKSVGEQLWCQIQSPPSTGKSVLCDAISICAEYVLEKSTIRGFHSGWKDTNGEDRSLITELAGKTLVTKDGDTLLTSPDLPRILAEGRDIYDKRSSSHFRNGEGKIYKGVQITWLLCGTSALRQLDSSELGARFLVCKIIDEIDEELEDEIAWRVANRASRSMHLEATQELESNYEPELLHAMKLTGGYVRYLRQNASELFSGLEISQEALMRCTKLAKFVAYIRARPSKVQNEKVEREFSSRLVSQHVRMAKCLAIVLNRTTVDDEVMRRVTKVSFDTASGQTLEIVDMLYESDIGVDLKTVTLCLNQTEEKTRALLRFMTKIKIVEKNNTVGLNGSRHSVNRWQLTDKVKNLYREIKEQ